MALRTKTYFWGDVIVLRCVGHLVAGEETTAFRQGVEKLLSGRRRVVINLTEVDHIDSTGLAALVHLLTQKRDPESGARLVSSRMRLTELLRRTKLEAVIMVLRAKRRRLRHSGSSDHPHQIPRADLHRPFRHSPKLRR